MNHLNAVAGTNSGQTGFISVCSQLKGWKPTGRPDPVFISLDWARDEQGRPVDTLFHAWQRQVDDATTAFISGKGWVPEAFRNSRGVDVIVHGDVHPDYVHSPEHHSFSDPPTDLDGRCDPESLYQRFNPVSLAMRAAPNRFPPDSWVVDAALKVFEQQSPGMAYVLLGQPDDTGHAFGAAWDTESRTEGDLARRPQLFCEHDPLHDMVTRANPRLFVEPILDATRDTDVQFGRLIRGLRRQGALANATVMVLSDHGMVTCLRGPGAQTQRELQAATDFYQLILDANLGTKRTVTPSSICSMGMLYWRRGKEQVAEAKSRLEEHEAVNPATGDSRCPWIVVDREEMIEGREGILPGELYHRWFVETDSEQTMIWPDLILLAKDGWELPAYGSGIGNLGIPVPEWMFVGPLYVFTGGHGAFDTQPILMAISRPGDNSGVSERDVRIGDLALTARDLFGLELESTTVGQSLIDDL